jgi:hypothetical protein
MHVTCVDAAIIPMFMAVSWPGSSIAHQSNDWGTGIRTRKR